MLEKLNMDLFEEKVLNIKGKAAVEFFAEWCGYCRVQEKVSERIMEAGSEVPIYLMDGDAYPELIEQLGIQGYPTYVLFKDGVPAEALVGANPEAQVRTFLDS